jgi:hypothetical protein
MHTVRQHTRTHDARVSARTSVCETWAGTRGGDTCAPQLLQHREGLQCVGEVSGTVVGDAVVVQPDAHIQPQPHVQPVRHTHTLTHVHKRQQRYAQTMPTTQPAHKSQAV